MGTCHMSFTIYYIQLLLLNLVYLDKIIKNWVLGQNQPGCACSILKRLSIIEPQINPVLTEVLEKGKLD